MKKLLLLSVLLLGASWAIAQTDSGQSSPTSDPSQTSPSQTSPSQSSPSQASPSTSSGEMSEANSGGATSIQGCLSGSEGAYTLTDKNGNSFRLSGDTAKLTEHVGHEVQVTGTTSSASASADSNDKMGRSSDTASGSSGSESTIEVTSVKHIAKTCKSGGMSH